MLITFGAGPLSMLVFVLVAAVSLAVFVLAGWFTDRLLGGYAQRWARQLQQRAER